MSGIKNKGSPEAAEAYRICSSVSGLIDRTFSAPMVAQASSAVLLLCFRFVSECCCTTIPNVAALEMYCVSMGSHERSTSYHWHLICCLMGWIFAGFAKSLVLLRQNYSRRC